MTSSATAALEAALHKTFDHATLAVYADHLQAQGDVRGELIAIDLEVAQRGTTAALVARRSELLHAWLGSLTAFDSARGGGIADSFRFGFFEDLELASNDPPMHDRLAALLAHPAGHYLRGLTLRGSARDLERALETLADAPNPWLRTLALANWGSGPRVDDAIAYRVIPALPALVRLAVLGDAVLGELPHPSVRELAITGADAFDGIYRIGPPLPEVTALDLAFDTRPPHGTWYDEEDDIDEPVVDVHHLISDVRLPALRTLDLSRNEPLRPDQPSYRVQGKSLWSYIGCLELRRRLTHLRLPALRDDEDTAELLDVLSSMPALVEVELGRGHAYQLPPLYHPTARFTIASPWPWPARAGGRRLRVTIPGARAPEVVELELAINTMPALWERLPDDARAAWRQVWSALEGSLPIDTLLLALEACGEQLDEGGWRELREALIDHRVPGARVELATV